MVPDKDALQLMWMVLLPSSSSLLGEYGNQLTAVINFSRDPRLMNMSRMDESELRYNELGLSVPLVFLVSIGVSFVSVTAAEYFWFLAFLVRPALLRIL